MRSVPYVESRMAFIAIVNLHGEVLRPWRGQFALFIQQVETTRDFGFDEV